MTRTTTTIRGAVLGLAIAMIAACGMTTDDPTPVPSDDPASAAPAIEAAPVGVPDELRAVSPRATCSSEGNACVSPGLCSANGGRSVSGSGCASGQICCSFNQCTNAGDACVSGNLCRANGGVSRSLSGCASGQVCCQF